MSRFKFRLWDKELKKMITPVGGYENYDLMQSTGFKDRNGTEIYEGDIIYYTATFLSINHWEVIWHEGAFYFRAHGSKQVFLLSEAEKENIEVISNIYEEKKHEQV